MLTVTENTLPRTTPEQQGIASSAILRFVEALDTQTNEPHSFIIVRHGSVVAEGWWSPYGRDFPHMLYSLSKSFTSTAIGLAVAEGLLSLDDAVISFFPDETPAEVSANLSAMRVRHLLSMSTGHTGDTLPPMVERHDADWTQAFFDVPVVHAPGTHFLYNTGATYMLSAIIQKTTGEKLIDYLQPRLFEPLGIENPTWEESPQGINTGGFGLNITTDDIAKFGQLYLQKGMWNGSRLLSEAWVDEATASHIANGTDPDSEWNQGYGFQFWRCRHNAYRGDGMFGQYCIVMPEQDAVVAMTNATDDMQKTLNCVWDFLLPAMNADALPDDPDAHAALTAKLNSLHFAPVPGQTASPMSAQVSGRTYTFDANPLELKTFSLNFSETECAVTVKTASGEGTFSCGGGNWQYGQTTLFNREWAFDPHAVATSGAWTADDTFSMIVRHYETPYYHTLVCTFAGDDVMIETRVNVSFGSLKPVLLVGRFVE